MNEIKTSTDQRNFSMIYHDFLDNNFLNGQEKLVFILLKRFSDSDGKCFPSINKLIELSQFSRSTIKRILKALEEKKVLSIEHRKTKEKGDTSNMYTLYDRADMWQKKELSHATTPDAQESSQPSEIDNKTEEKESQADSKNIEVKASEEKQECMDSKDERQEEKRAEQEEKDQNGSGIESVDIESHKWHSDSSGCSDSKEVLEAYETLIKNNIAYDDLCISHQYDKKLIDELISNILDVVMSNNATIKIAGEQKNIELVKSVLLKLNYYQIEYVIQKYKQVTTRITNKRQYILTMLYNSHLESESDVVNEVAHDLSVLPPSTTGDREKDIKNLANYLL